MVKTESNTTMSTKMQGKLCVFLVCFLDSGPIKILTKEKTRLLHQHCSKRKRKRKNGRENGYRVSLLTVSAICSAL